MRVVLDTNVVVSALLWSGTPHRLLHFAVSGEIVLYTSPILIAELCNVLTRSHLAKHLSNHFPSVDEAIRHYRDLTISVSPVKTARIVASDADDDHVLAAALAAAADCIITGDLDLLSIRSYEQVSIVTPAQAVSIIAPGQS